MKISITLMLCVAVFGFGLAIADANESSNEDALRKEFFAHNKLYMRKYRNRMETDKAFILFKKAKHVIDKHNKKYAKKEVSYEIGLNQFSTMGEEELRFTRGLVFSRKLAIK